MAVDLKKGSQINLMKSGDKHQVCVGINWGAIRKKVLFGLLEQTEDVDLDCSAAIYDQSKKLIEVVYFRNLRSKDGSVVHSGDDLAGDQHGDDGLDNEVITIDFQCITSNARSIVLFLNSYKKQDFADIPYSKIRIFEGNPRRVDEVLADFNLSSDKGFSGYVSMIMGKFWLDGEDSWTFSAIGEPTKTWRILDTLDVIQEKYA